MTRTLSTDLAKMLSEFILERGHIEQAIMALETIAPKCRVRPPKRMMEVQGKPGADQSSGGSNQPPPD